MFLFLRRLGQILMTAGLKSASTEYHLQHWPSETGRTGPGFLQFCVSKESESAATALCAYSPELAYAFRRPTTKHSVSSIAGTAHSQIVQSRLQLLHDFIAALIVVSDMSESPHLAWPQWSPAVRRSATHDHCDALACLCRGYTLNSSLPNPDQAT